MWKQASLKETLVKSSQGYRPAWRRALHLLVLPVSLIQEKRREETGIRCEGLSQYKIYQMCFCPTADCGILESIRFVRIIHFFELSLRNYPYAMPTPDQVDGRSPSPKPGLSSSRQKKIIWNGGGLNNQSTLSPFSSISAQLSSARRDSPSP